MLRVGPHLGERHLMRAPRPLDRQAVDHLRPGPSLRRLEHDHRPTRPGQITVVARPPLDLSDLVEHIVERRRHQAVHLLGIRALDESRRVPIAFEQAPELISRDPREHRRVGDLVAVQVEHRQHRAVARRVQELVRVPARGQRTGLRLAVADHAQRQQVRVVQDRAVGVEQASIQAHRPRGSTPASRVRRGSGFLPGTRTAGTAGAIPLRRARCGGTPRCRSRRGRCSRRYPDRRDRGRSRRSRSGCACGSPGSCGRRRSSARGSSPSGRATGVLCARGGAVRGAAGSRAGRSGRPTGSSRRATTHSSPRALRGTVGFGWALSR